VQLAKGQDHLIKGSFRRKVDHFDALPFARRCEDPWEFPPRAHKTGKDRQAHRTKVRAKVDLSKAKVIGESKVHAASWRLDDAYYVRSQTRTTGSLQIDEKICEHDITQMSEGTPLRRKSRSSKISPNAATNSPLILSSRRKTKPSSSSSA